MIYSDSYFQMDWLCGALFCIKKELAPSSLINSTLSIVPFSLNKSVKRTFLSFFTVILTGKIFNHETKTDYNFRHGQQHDRINTTIKTRWIIPWLSFNNNRLLLWLKDWWFIYIDGDGGRDLLIVMYLPNIYFLNHCKRFRVWLPQYRGK